MRTLQDLAAVLDVEHLAIAVESARRKKVVTVEGLERRLQTAGTQGRRGMGNIARVLADCRARTWILDSALEVRFWWWLKGSGLPLPIPGVPFEDDHGQMGRIDFAYERQRLALETDGFETHGQREIFERDSRRWSRLAALGWRVVHITDRWLTADPDEIRSLIEESLKALDSARAERR